MRKKRTYIALGIIYGLVLGVVMRWTGILIYMLVVNGIVQKKNIIEMKYGQNTTDVVYTITTNAAPNEKFTGTYRQAMEYLIQKEYKGFDPEVINKKFGNIK